MSALLIGGVGGAFAIGTMQISAVGWSAASAVAAAIAAIFTARSAAATQATADEMRRTRFESKEPQLSYSPLDRHLRLEIDSGRPKVSLLGDEENRNLSLVLENLSSGPALDINVSIYAEGGHKLVELGDLSRVPIDAIGVTWFENDHGFIEFERALFAIHRKAKVFIPHCSDGTKQSIILDSTFLLYLSLKSAISFDIDTASIAEQELPRLVFDIEYKTVYREDRRVKFEFSLELQMLKVGSEYAFRFRSLPVNREASLRSAGPRRASSELSA